MALLILVLVALGFGPGAWRGATYLPVMHRDAEAMLDLADLKPGEMLIDLGSGDGRLLREAARRGARGIGYEINPWLYLVSRIVLWRYRKRVRVHLRDYWLLPLPEADVIYVFLIERYMERLDEKLGREIARPTRVVSYVFSIPRRTPERSLPNAWLYRYGLQRKGNTS